MDGPSAEVEEETPERVAADVLTSVSSLSSITITLLLLLVLLLLLLLLLGTLSASPQNHCCRNSVGIQ